MEEIKTFKMSCVLGISQRRRWVRRLIELDTGDGHYSRTKSQNFSEKDQNVNILACGPSTVSQLLSSAIVA